MKSFFETDGKPLTVMFKVKTKSPQKIRVVMFDAKKPFSRYTNRYMTVDGVQKFFIRLPIAPKKGVIKVFNEANGSKKKGLDKSFQVSQFYTLPLDRKLKCFDNSNPVIRNFVKFAEEFSQNAGILSAGTSIYTSDDGEFVVEYMDDIRDRETGQPLNTPARISQREGLIQISKRKFLEYTIPMRMIILLHEFSHFYLNKDMANEQEADLNALLIYLGLGYPRIEAFQAFTKVFYNSPSKGNAKRFQVLNKFITDFENNKFCIKYN